MPNLPASALTTWHKKYPDLTVLRTLKSGKEADLWLVQVKGELRALKVYADTSLSTRSRYTEGQWVNQPSLRKAADIRHNPNWEELYERDLKNVRGYFERQC